MERFHFWIQIKKTSPFSSNGTHFFIANICGIYMKYTICSKMALEKLWNELGCILSCQNHTCSLISSCKRVPLVSNDYYWSYSENKNVSIKNKYDNQMSFYFLWNRVVKTEVFKTTNDCHFQTFLFQERMTSIKSKFHFIIECKAFPGQWTKLQTGDSLNC